MSIKDHDRKVLWARSGNRCAICRTILVAHATADDRESVVGEEAHIVAEAPGGPRHALLDPPEFDGYTNLVLLCRVDHKLVDDQRVTYSPDRLRQIKLSHESWVADTLSAATQTVAGVSELPRVRQGLVNRERELAALTELMEQAATEPGPSIALLTGMPGVGKSAVGAHWAVRNRERFQSGALFGDFGRHRRREGVRVSDILAGFLGDLGTPEQSIPPTFAGRQQMFRRLTASKRLLVYLDDVDHPAHVNAVLPAGSGSVVIVTSNYRLEQLLYEGAKPIPVDPMDGATSHRLLASMVGSDRIDAEPGAVAELIELCGGLPIALCVCGGTLAGSGRGRSVAWLVDGIRHSGRRVRALSRPGSLSAEAMFDFAYHRLPAPAAELYRNLGVNPGRDFTAPVAASLVNCSLADALRTLDLLHAAHLVETQSDGRFRLHDLIRDHAEGLGQNDESMPGREEAVRRVVEWYYAALRLADQALVPDRLRLSRGEHAPVADLPVFGTPQEATEWFIAERPNVIAVLHSAFDHEWDELVWQLAEASWLFYLNHKWYSEWVDTHTLAVTAACRAGNRAAEARMRAQLSRAYGEQGEVERATEEMRLAVAAADASRNSLLKASVTEFMGHLELDRANLDGALDAFMTARSIFEACGRTRGVALQNYHIGRALVRSGRYERALPPLTLALDVLASLGPDPTVGRVLMQRAESLRAVSRHSDARLDISRALMVARRFGIRFDEARAYEILAAVAEEEDRPDEARDHRQSAYRLYKEIGHPRADDVFQLLN